MGQKEKSKGNEENAKWAKEYCSKVEAELQKICDTILGLLDSNLIVKASTGESKVFYQKMKADYFRYIAEFSADNAKSAAAESARQAYEEASSCTRCCRTLTTRARWPAPPSRMRLRSSTMWPRTPTRTRRSSCSCSATTSRSGPLTRRPGVSRESLAGQRLHELPLLGRDR